MLKKIAPSIAIVSILMLAGCSNTTNLEQQIQTLSSKVDSLTMKVDAMSSDVAASKSMSESNNTEIKMLKSAVDSASANANKANMRLDNLVSSYKK